MSNPIIPTVTMNNGVEIPQVGLGIFQANEGPADESA